jgi:hypothetical protein
VIVTIGKSSPQGPEEVDSEKFWDERGPRTKYIAV